MWPFKDFQCEQCGTAFAHKIGLAAHVKSVHEDHRPHKCHTCDKAFTHSGELKRKLLTLRYLQTWPFVSLHKTKK